MENLPAYISLFFLFTLLLTVFFFYRAAGRSFTALIMVFIWLFLQSAIGMSGFYTHTSGMPPRFILLIGPPLLLITFLFLTSSGRKLIDKWDAEWLHYLHIVRVPVELVLLGLCIYKQVPQLMTFEGRNFDILSGLTAPFVAYFRYSRPLLNTKFMLMWNFICLGLLFNIVTNAILSAPFPFQQFAFEQPDTGVLYFPFMLLPGFIVPMVLLSHLTCIRRLLQEKS